MKAFWISLVFCICTYLYSNAQLTREMTVGEIAFYQRMVNLVVESFPHQSIQGWNLVSHTDLNFYRRIDISREKNRGPYSYNHEILFARPAEHTQHLLDSVTRLMEQTTDAAKINALGVAFQEISLAGEMRVRITINSEHAALTDCTGKVRFPKFSNKEYHWGIDIQHAAVVSGGETSGTPCKSETQIAFGKSNPFRFFKYDTGDGGNVVSAIELPKQAGEQAFGMYNIIIGVEASSKEANQFFQVVNWPKLAAALAR